MLANWPDAGAIRRADRISALASAISTAISSDLICVCTRSLSSLASVFCACISACLDCRYVRNASSRRSFGITFSAANSVSRSRLAFCRMVCSLARSSRARSKSSAVRICRISCSVSACCNNNRSSAMAIFAVSCSAIRSFFPTISPSRQAPSVTTPSIAATMARS